MAPSKPESADKMPMLKGPAAEKAVKEYVNACNRPYGAADIAANMKTVSKPTAQKILVALAEKREITQKTIGKQTYFVANQTDILDVPPEKIKELEEQLIGLNERVKTLTASNKVLAAESTSIRLLPTNAELPTLLSSLQQQLVEAEAALAPYRANNNAEAPLTDEELAALDVGWAHWRAEWKKRKMWFTGLWSQVTDQLTPDAIDALVEELGFEFDSPEHQALERGPLCQPAARFKRTAPIKPAGISR